MAETASTPQLTCFRGHELGLEHQHDGRAVLGVAELMQYITTARARCPICGEVVDPRASLQDFPVFGNPEALFGNASESRSIAIDKLTDARDSLSIEVVKLTDASDSLSIAVDKVTDACDSLSIAVDKLTEASDSLSIAIDKLTDASESLSIAVEKLTKASESLSIAVDKLTDAPESLSIAIDRLTDASESLSIEVMPRARLALRSPTALQLARVQGDRPVPVELRGVAPARWDSYPTFVSNATVAAAEAYDHGAFRRTYLVGLMPSTEERPSSLSDMPIGKSPLLRAFEQRARPPNMRGGTP